MSSGARVVAKKALKLTGAFAVASGVVVLSAVVASGAAVGAIVEGFKAAGETFHNVLKREETKGETLDQEEIVVVSKDI